ncbi:MAG: hypothetical protein ACO1N2_04540 [Candidatus Saccharimonadota bacterium]|jgi:hypothetical protein
MSAEELHNASPEKGAENKELSPEQLESYLKAEAAVERAAEKSKVENGERSESKARAEALKEAVSVERASAEKKGKEASGSPAKRRHGVVSKKERNASYKQHLKHLQNELTPAQRGFSKVIHNPVVEKTSEVVGSTIARPNAILAGAVVAFIAVLGVYLVAKHYGYVLSGFETIAAFIVGWVVGMLYDFFKVMITGKKA